MLQHDTTATLPQLHQRGIELIAFAQHAGGRESETTAAVKESLGNKALTELLHEDGIVQYLCIEWQDHRNAFVIQPLHIVTEKSIQNIVIQPATQRIVRQVIAQQGFIHQQPVSR